MSEETVTNNNAELHIKKGRKIKSKLIKLVCSLIPG